MIRFVLSLVLVLALSSVSFAGGVAVAVPSCQQAVTVQSQAVAVQAYAPVQVTAPLQVAVPVYAQQQVAIVQQQQQHVAVVRQNVAVVKQQHNVRVQVQNQPRPVTLLGNIVQGLRRQRGL